MLTLIVTELPKTTGNQVYRTARYMDKRALRLADDQRDTTDEDQEC